MFTPVYNADDTENSSLVGNDHRESRKVFSA